MVGRPVRLEALNLLLRRAESTKYLPILVPFHTKLLSTVFSDLVIKLRELKLLGKEIGLSVVSFFVSSKRSISIALLCVQMWRDDSCCARAYNLAPVFQRDLRVPVYSCADGLDIRDLGAGGPDDCDLVAFFLESQLVCAF